MHATIYPNPNVGQFVVIYEGEESESLLTVNDSYGRLIYSDKKTLQKNERRQIQLNQPIATGLYFVELRTELGVYRKQIIISN
jgi:hypothetical protein